MITDHVSVHRGVEDYIANKGWTLRDYQEYIKRQTFNCGFLRLPTGDGKTETALLPRVRGINKDGYFGKDNVSFSHHLLFLSLHEEERLDEKKYHEYNIKIVDEIHSYSPPKLIEEELKRRIGTQEILPWDKVKRRYSDKNRVRIHLRDDCLIKKINMESTLQNI